MHDYNPVDAQIKPGRILLLTNKTTPRRHRETQIEEGNLIKNSSKVSFSHFWLYKISLEVNRIRKFPISKRMT